MDISKNCECISSKAVSFESSVEQPIQCDITLPDYFPDIVKVVRCKMRADILSVSVAPTKMTVDGKAVASVLYISDDGRAHCFEQRVPFSKSIDIKNGDVCIYSVDTTTEYVNCRVVSQRKLDIHAGITVSYKESYKKNDNLFCGCDEKSVCIRSNKINSAVLKDCNVNYFGINETVEIGAEQPNVSQIVSSSADAVISSTKLVADKILVKGELSVKILYLSEGQQDFQSVTSSIPFSQIIETKSDDDSMPFVKLKVKGYDIYAKTDSSGALRLFDLSAVICAEVSVYDNKEINVIDDLYSTRYEVKPTFSEADIYCGLSNISDTYLVRSGIDAGDTQIKGVIDASVENYSVSSDYCDGVLKYTITAQLNVLAATENDGIVFYEKKMDYDVEKRLDFDVDSLFAESSVTLNGMNYSIQSDNSIEMRIEFEINSMLFERKNMRIITDISLNDKPKADTVSKAVSIYFADRGEKLWDIAKHFNSTVEKLKSENSITGEVLENDKRLIVISD